MAVWLQKAARVALEDEALRKRVVETGGGIFGYEDGVEIVIVSVCGPGRKARHRPFTFTPDRDFIDSEIRRIYEESEGRYRYLGSWHSHPFGSARPSPVDTATAEMIATEVEVRLPRPILLIQSLHPLRRRGKARVGELGAFRWSRAHRRLDACEVLDVPAEEVSLAAKQIDGDLTRGRN